MSGVRLQSILDALLLFQKNNLFLSVICSESDCIGRAVAYVFDSNCFSVGVVCSVISLQVLNFNDKNRSDSFWNLNTLVALYIFD